MEEKYMVNDILECTKTGLKDYQSAIVETANMELRQTFQNLRNLSESFQYELFKLAESKGYYTSSENAKPEEIQKVKKELGN